MSARIYKKRKDAQPVGEIITQWFKRLRLVKPGVAEQVWEIWQQCLGERARHTTYRSLRRQMVYFDVDSAPLKAEIETFLKYEILRRLQSEVKSVFIRDIRLRNCDTLEGGGTGKEQYGKKE
ncbi:MAG: DUF721 domain-containing protein [Planctomycetia bacterium]|nr:DUF721 domain-containing protein [Planctomycetia bacterium]